MVRLLLIVMVVIAVPVMAQNFKDNAPPDFSDGEVYVEPTVAEQEVITMAQRFAKCGAYRMSAMGSEDNFPQAAFRIMTELSYFHPDKADEIIMAAFEDQQVLLEIMDENGDDEQIASVAEECDNLAEFKNEVIEMEREIYE